MGIEIEGCGEKKEREEGGGVMWRLAPGQERP